MLYIPLHSEVHKKTPKNTRNRYGNASTLQILFFHALRMYGGSSTIIRIYLWHVQIKETFNYLKMFSCVLIKWSLILLWIGYCYGCRRYRRCCQCLHTHCKYNLNVCTNAYSARQKSATARINRLRPFHWVFVALRLHYGIMIVRGNWLRFNTFMAGTVHESVRNKYIICNQT